MSRHSRCSNAAKTRLDSDRPTLVRIAEAVLRARLEQFEQTREFFLAMWLQNPAFARNTGARIAALLSPLQSRE